MAIISKEEFEELANFRADYCISIHIPTHQAGVEVNELKDAIVFKDKLDEAHKYLEEKGLPADDIRKITDPGDALIHNEEFWHRQSHGLSVFMADQFFKLIKVPVSFKGEVFTGHSFYLTPLMPVVNKTKHFFVLTFSKNDAAIYEGDAFGLRKVEMDELPNGMDDVIRYEKKGGKQTFRRGGRNAEASFHGESSGLADEQEYVARYLQEVDRTLMDELLATQRSPLVLAAVKDMVAAYKEVSDYRYITEEAITGNHEGEDVHSLFAQAKEILAPYFKEDLQKALDNYYNNVASDFTSSTAADIIPAGYYARIADLFVQKDAHIWGTFDENENNLQLHPERQQDDDCLLNRAAIKTWLNEGNVYLLEKEQMPNGSKMAAFFRYPVNGQ